MSNNPTPDNNDILRALADRIADATGGAGSFTGWNLSLARAQGAPGEVTNAALAAAIAGTSANTNAIPTLDTPYADPGTEEIRQAFNALVLGLRR